MKTEKIQLLNSDESFDILMPETELEQQLITYACEVAHIILKKGDPESLKQYQNGYAIRIAKIGDGVKAVFMNLPKPINPKDLN